MRVQISVSACSEENERKRERSTETNVNFQKLSKNISIEPILLNDAISDITPSKTSVHNTIH
uniref:Uncharacterized protein n=1 Tax=Nelumbo nucifera TaxID=4432 RepID=A0A822Y1Z9_NELNU|nr:TPA_asm: hypothetical protein HUJ06_026760 [Nelumbo nucifera]